MSKRVSAIEAALVKRLGGSDALAAMQRASQALLTNAGFERPPTKLSSLARFLGATIQYEAKQGIGGEEASLKIVDNKMVLWVSREKFENRRTRNRARFSIAHEIAHLMLYKIFGPTFLEVSEQDDETYRFVERLCDTTAAYLLLPSSFLLEAVRSYGISSIGIAKIARTFDVSYTALFRAIAGLTKESAILDWRFFQRSVSEQITWRVWQSFSSSGAERNLSWLPTGTTLSNFEGIGSPEELAFDEVIGVSGIKIIKGERHLERDVILCRWPLGNRNAAFDFGESSRAAAGLLNIDETLGRLVALVAPRNRIDFSQYGVAGLQ